MEKHGTNLLKEHEANPHVSPLPAASSEAVRPRSKLSFEERSHIVTLQCRVPLGVKLFVELSLRSDFQ